MSDQVLTITDITKRVAEALTASRIAPDIAVYVIDALIRAECDGQVMACHGWAVMRHRHDQKAMVLPVFPSPIRSQPADAVDVASGFAYPALDAVNQELPALARTHGIAMGLHHSHHCGVAGHHVEAAADQGMIALLFANTPSAMAPWGGRTALRGYEPDCICRASGMRYQLSLIWPRHRWHGVVS